MKPIPFSEQEHVMAPPQGTHETIQGLRVIARPYSVGGIRYTSCWELTPEEIETISKTGKLYISCLGIQPAIKPHTEIEL